MPLCGGPPPCGSALEGAKYAGAAKVVPRAAGIACRMSNSGDLTQSRPFARTPAPSLEINMSTFTVIPHRRPSNLRGTDESLMDFQRRRELEAEARLEH